MDFLTSKKYIDSLSRFGSVLGLGNIKSLLERMDNPQNNLNVIHVAGTNGKGSTIAYIEAILRASGYRVAKYCSPVVFEYLEKYKINGENISEEEFAEAVTAVRVHIEYLNKKNINPTLFEVETALAFKIFADKEVDIALIETGMGGDEDATNVCDRPLLSVITSISYDHMAFLGNTIKEIAGHKAGIIKYNVPAVVNGCNKEALDTVKGAAELKNSRLWISSRADMEKGTYTASDGTVIDGLQTKMEGSCQNENIALAIEGILALNECYGQKDNISFNISIQEIREGIKKAFIPGRFEKISDNPPVYIDGAHNPDAVLKLRSTLEEKFADKKKLFVMGVLADKDYDKECSIICNMADRIITVTPDNPRALDGSCLTETIKKYNKAVRFADSIEAACKEVKTGREDIAVVFGSLSYLGEFKKLMEKEV